MLLGGQKVNWTGICFSVDKNVFHIRGSIFPLKNLESNSLFFETKP